jgi:chromate transporter
MFYKIHGDHPYVTYMLKGVAAAAAGLLLATCIQLGKKSLSHRFDLVFVLVTVLAVNRLHLGVPKTLVIVGLVAIFFHYPRKAKKAEVSQ